MSKKCKCGCRCEDCYILECDCVCHCSKACHNPQEPEECEKGCLKHKYHCGVCNSPLTYSPANYSSRPVDIPNPCENCNSKNKLLDEVLRDNEPEWEARKRCKVKPFEEEPEEWVEKIKANGQNWIDEDKMIPFIHQLIQKSYNKGFKTAFEESKVKHYEECDYDKGFKVGVESRNEEIKEWERENKKQVPIITSEDSEAYMYSLAQFNKIVGYNQALQDLLEFLNKK